MLWVKYHSTHESPPTVPFFLLISGASPSLSLFQSLLPEACQHSPDHYWHCSSVITVADGKMTAEEPCWPVRWGLSGCEYEPAALPKGQADWWHVCSGEREVGGASEPWGCGVGGTPGPRTPAERMTRRAWCITSAWPARSQCPPNAWGSYCRVTFPKGAGSQHREMWCDRKWVASPTGTGN